MKRPSEEEMNLAYRQFADVCWKVPMNIHEKLRNMPNNKGFIINGVWFFGLQRPSSRKILVMFEKLYPKLYIHEITLHHYKVICTDMNTREKYVVENVERGKKNRRAH